MFAYFTTSALMQIKANYSRPHRSTECAGSPLIDRKWDLFICSFAGNRGKCCRRTEGFE